MELRRLFFGLASLLFAATPGWAGQFHDFYLGTRANAMGGAYVAVADDEQAIFLNPAGLAGNKKYQLHYAVVDVMGTTDTALMALQGATLLGNISPATLNELMGKNISLRAQVTPTLMMPGLGVSLMMDGQGAVHAKNIAQPQIEVGYQNTNGLQLAYGVSVLRGRAKGRSDLRIGAAAKVLWRRGGYRKLSITEMFQLDANALSRIAGVWGLGYGGDLGAQYIFQLNNKISFMSGIAYTNAGDIAFGAGPDPIKGNLTAGLAAQYEFRGTRILLAYDYAHILDATDWRKKNHLGLELGLPLLSVYGGLNQTYLSYGASFDLWLFRITAASYAVENGSFVFQDPERQWALKVGLKFNL